jgi:stage V sporulation protein AC
MNFMNITPQAYKKMTDNAAPRSNTAVNTTYAFVIGGGICVIGQLILSAFQNMGFSLENAGTWTSVILVCISALLTGLGWYERLAKHAGAGTLVPITGFSNAVSSSAVEAQSEGLVLGVGTKIFTIAGPVILYGIFTSWVLGVIYWITTLF